LEQVNFVTSMLDHMVALVEVNQSSKDTEEGGH
jgi:hypothetical protein